MIYKETMEGSFTFGNLHIPKADGNRHYEEMKTRLASGEATLQYYNSAEDDAAAALGTEVEWVRAALVNSDVELAYVQDGDTRATGTVAAWRAYRCALRDYTVKDEFTGVYTVVGVRPVSPRGPFEA
jgi:hypothetical protein